MVTRMILNFDTFKTGDFAIQVMTYYDDVYLNQQKFLFSCETGKLNLTIVCRLMRLANKRSTPADIRKTLYASNYAKFC